MTRLQIEAEKVTWEVKHTDAEVLKFYAGDLKCFLEEDDVVESKAFFVLFIKRIEAGLLLNNRLHCVACNRIADC